MGQEELMPIADYLKTAAAQLRQAADAAKREADEIRADIIRREQDLKRNISNLENVIISAALRMLSRRGAANWLFVRPKTTTRII
jgi:hypothetical protein